MAATTFDQLQRALRGKIAPPVSPMWTIDPVEIAAQNFEQSGAPIRTELYGNVPGALDIASRRPALAPAIPSYSPPALSIGPSPNPNPEPLRDAQELNLPQSIPPMPPVGAQMGAGEADAVFGGMGAGIGGYVPLPPPVRREIPIQSYAFPNAPQAPEYQAAPMRNLEAERKSLNRGTGLAGLAGLLLGGAPGALAAASGYKDAGQKSFDGQFGQQAAQVEAQNALLGNRFKNQLGQYDSQLDAIRMQMAGDDRDATLIERENANRDRAYNQNEANRIKVYNAGVADRAKGEVRKILQQRADTGDLNAQTNLMGMLSIIDDRKQRADLMGEQFDFKKEMELLGYDFKTKQFNWQKEYQGRMADTAAQNATTNAERVRLMREAGNATRQIQRDRLEFDRMTKGVKGSAGFTPAQQLTIDRELGGADATIQGIRNRAGKAPDATKDPTGYAQWAENRRAWESAAQEKRKYFDALAEKSGYKKTGTGYEKITPVGAPRTTSDPGYDAAMRGGSPLVGLPPRVLNKAGVPANPPKTLEGRGVAPTVNPAAQSGNRAAMSRSATPAPQEKRSVNQDEEIRKGLAQLEWQFGNAPNTPARTTSMLPKRSTTTAPPRATPAPKATAGKSKDRLEWEKKVRAAALKMAGG